MTRRNRTYRKCSSPHGKGPHRLVVCRAVDVKVREQLILLLQEDSADSSADSGRVAGDFPEGGEPALFGHENRGKHSLGASSAQELPGPKLKAEISDGRSRLCCALSQLPSRYPSYVAEGTGGATWLPVVFLCALREPGSPGKVLQALLSPRREMPIPEHPRHPGIPHGPSRPGEGSPRGLA